MLGGTEISVERYVLIYTSVIRPEKYSRVIEDVTELMDFDAIIGK